MIIVVPYRDRQAHLNQFVPHMNKRFKDATILVVEQTGTKPFNRGKLLNIGFLEERGTYYAFHDVDMLPIQADYSFPESPAHLATKAEQFGFRMPFAEYFGGVTLFSREDFERCNGYTNEMFGWGAEDDDLRNAVLACGLQIQSRQCTYRSLSHPRKIDSKLHQENCRRLKEGRSAGDGLTGCTYTVVERKAYTGYNKIIVEI